MAPKVMRAYGSGFFAAKAVASRFCVWMKDEAGVWTIIRVRGNPTVKDFMVDALEMLIESPSRTP